MSSPQAQQALTVNAKGLTAVVLSWWLLSLIVAWVLLDTSYAVPLLDAVREAIPAVQKYALASANPLAVTAFHLFFLLTTPIVAIWYFKYAELTKPLGKAVTVVLWLALVCCVFFMTIGIDFGAAKSPGFRRSFYLVLNSSWLGSSFIFLLFCHCLLLTAVCLTGIKGRSS